MSDKAYFEDKMIKYAQKIQSLEAENTELKEKLSVAVDALGDIFNMDYKGLEYSPETTAEEALAKTGEMG